MTEHKFQVSQCCCCCTLRTGAIIIGFLDLIVALCNAGYTGYLAAAHGAGALWFNVIISVLIAIVAILLLNGVRTSAAKQVWVWVYVTIVLVVLTIIGAIIGVVSSGDIGALVGGLITAALMFYFVVVVRSFAFELESGGGGGNKV